MHFYVICCYLLKGRVRAAVIISNIVGQMKNFDTQFIP